MITWLENHMMPCFYKEYSGVDCPGCGIQRSFVELLKGNFAISFELYPGLIPIIITLVYTGLHLILKFKNGATIIKYSFIITISIVTLSYMFKLLG